MTNKPQIRQEKDRIVTLIAMCSDGEVSINPCKYSNVKQFLATIEERAEKRGREEAFKLVNTANKAADGANKKQKELVNKQLKQRIKDEVLYHPINGNEKADTQYIALEKVFKDI